MYKDKVFLLHLLHADHHVQVIVHFGRVKALLIIFLGFFTFRLRQNSAITCYKPMVLG